MFFQSEVIKGQWDTWLYWHDGMFYLYFLAGSSGIYEFKEIGLATSSDGVHWIEYGTILKRADNDVLWGTGFTWRSPVKKAFSLNFSQYRNSRQKICFAESMDLIHWEGAGDSCDFHVDERWYEPDGRWDCIYVIPNPEGGLFGYWTATPRAFTQGQFGFGRSQDGLHWEALEPPRVEGVGVGEVGAVEKIGNRYYMMYGVVDYTIHEGESILNDGTKMVVLVADRPEGPFHLAKKNPDLLAGRAYFSRFFATPEGLLVNHHTFISPVNVISSANVFFSPLKRACVDDEGTLRLRWWSGNDVLKNQRADVSVSEAGSRLAWIAEELDVQNGIVVEALIHLERSNSAFLAGFYLEYASNLGVAIRIHRNAFVEIGLMDDQDFLFDLINFTDREINPPEFLPVRLLLKGSLLEFYCDDYFVQSWSLPKRSTGRVGIIKPEFVSSLEVWRC